MTRLTDAQRDELRRYAEWLYKQGEGPHVVLYRLQDYVMALSDTDTDLRLNILDGIHIAEVAKPGKDDRCP